MFLDFFLRLILEIATKFASLDSSTICDYFIRFNASLDLLAHERSHNLKLDSRNVDRATGEDDFVDLLWL